MVRVEEGDFVFRFGMLSLNVSRAWELVNSGDVPYTAQKINITRYAESMLAMSRDNLEPVSAMMRIDYDHMRSITPERAQEPTLWVQIDAGWLCVDGNHRIANAYTDETYVVNAFMVRLADVDKLHIPRPWPSIRAKVPKWFPQLQE